ncbi:MAG: VRR-NUC domain-containing protein [Anaerotignum sp.]|nr:VRR-NUC domain-containing protein [Anaerotignum sp.]
MRESNIQNSIRCALSKRGIVFRTNAGTFYQGKVVFSKEFGQRVLINLRRVDGLPAGFSDLVFFGPGAQTAFIETKNEVGRLRPEQKVFLERMQSMGFSAGVARSDAEAVGLIEKEKG